MAVTLTYTAGFSNPAKSVHVGLNAFAFDVVSTAKFGSISDVYVLAKLPNGALVTQADIRFGSLTGGANSTMQLVAMAVEAGGSYSVIATLINSMTASGTAATTFNTRVPTKISLSDDRAVQYAVLALNVTTGVSATVSVSFQGSVLYMADGSVL